MSGTVITADPTTIGLSTDLWIDGRRRPAMDGGEFSVHDPATEVVIATVADATAEDALDALTAAAAVQDSWAATAPRERSEILRSAFEIVSERSEDFARLISSEMGKTLAEARGEVAYGAEYLRWFAEEAVRIDGRFTRSPSGAGQIMVTKVPVGPVLAITPWNFPLAMGTRKIGPALAAGCTIIVKPAEDTPLTMLLLAEVFDAAGLPPGVLSVLPTTSSALVAETLMGDPRLRKVTFTGSTAVGKVLVRSSADQLLRTSMELGGNAPFLVLDDADIAEAVDGAMAAKMRNGGQACTAANRFYVTESVASEFTDALAARIAALRVGPGTDPLTDVGPLINRRQAERVARLVEDAVTDGARLRVGGAIGMGEGHFFAPTLLDQVPADARILREEIFGPVAAVVTVADEDEAVVAANATDYGLAGYLYTRDVDRAAHVCARMATGMVGINRGIISDVAAPFGGVRQSGFGREGGAEGIEEYLDAKYIAI
ncbi:NAD-dependent succinate-semialdehyde dehydrogenase [Gordonia soli]|uniref:Succinate-semialdehyde dehydrogenase n=1 Tax=Gordonia soli NBRC 108243 TaxID=1223545 RepID=M0QFM4_9ACTN|nr:NAD-dependent succinate-semialdehyde dehydrogenase [Gordonia soli]GAC67395.1 succinate-semialdehyde dehydrogenase [Gordonia soli NBRC 108243]